MDRRAQVPAAVAIYVRISRDREREGLGVERQRRDCQEWCEQKGWLVAEVYEDNDISAYSGKRRPRYEAMLEAIERGDRDAVVAWHPDRLHRSPVELERFIDLVERTQVVIGTVMAGTYDLTTSSGRMTARVLGATARAESEHKSDRLCRKQVELAEKGKLSGGGRRPYGYERDRVTVREDEAEVIRDLAKRFLSGESLYFLAGELNRRELWTTTGAPWRTSAVRQMLKSGRISGRREHRGEIASNAIWPAIISAKDSDAIRLILADPSRRQSPGPARTYLLSGFLRCGRCNFLLRSRRKHDRTMSKTDMRMYGCYDDHYGCKRLTIVAPELEDFVVAGCLVRLDDPAFGRTARVEEEDRGEVELIELITTCEADLEQMAYMKGRGEISLKEWMILRRETQERLEQARTRLHELQGVQVLSPWIGRATELKNEWPSLSLSKKRAFIASILDYAVISPARPGNRFDGARVEPFWRL